MLKKSSRKGFTLVELIVVLAIVAILAALVGAGIISYVNLARFNKNEANARTVFYAAQTALTRLDASGGLDGYIEKVEGSEGAAALGVQDSFFPGNTEGLTDEEKDELGAIKDRVNTRVYALYYDKDDPDSAASKLVTQLLGEYVYDASLLDASICLEIDVRSGEIFAVFYDTNSAKLRFGEETGATDITDRRYAYRSTESRVGYYSVDDLVNVVSLDLIKLKINSISLVNGETLTLNWSSNASGAVNPNIIYTAAVCNAAGDTQFTIEINLKDYTAQSDRVTCEVTFPGSAATVSYTFPLSNTGGTYTMTLDAMASAEILRGVAVNAGVANSSLFSITRFFTAANPIPDSIYVKMQAKPAPNTAEQNLYTESEWRGTKPRSPLFGDGATAAGGSLVYYRHLYNLRWLGDAATGKYTLAPERTANNVLNWTSGKVTVYQATKQGAVVNGEQTYEPEAANPTAETVVPFPTIESLPAGVTLGGNGVTLRGVQLRTESVPADSEYYAKYVGLIGHNYGTVTNLVLQDVDAVVNLVSFEKNQTDVNIKTALDNAVTAVEDGKFTEKTAADFGAAVNEAAPLTALRGVGALCGINTGVVNGVQMTESTTGHSRVVAVVPFGDALTATGQREDATDDAKISANLQNSTAVNLRGIGGLVGISRPAYTTADEISANEPAATGRKYSLANLTTNGTVSGLLLDGNPKTGAAPTDSAHYANAQTATAGTVYRPIGIGGIAGMVLTQAEMAANNNLVLTNNTVVRGNAFAGGVFGNALAKTQYTPAAGETPATAVALTGIGNTGRVMGTAEYDAESSAVLGQFFGGVVGYTAFNSLSGIHSKTSAENALSMDEVTAQITDLLQGDFVGGIAGFADSSTLTDCTVGDSASLTSSSTAKTNSFVLGSCFVGGFVGGNNASITGSTGSGANYSFVLGKRYVGGVASVNSAGGQIENVTNYAPVAAVQLAGDDSKINAAFAGGIVGYNGFDDEKDKPSEIAGCGSNVIDDSNKYADFLLALGANEADFIGGIAGYNAGKISEMSAVTIVLEGHDYVGGLAGANAADAEITVENQKKALSISGHIGGNLAVGGVVGFNAGQSLPAKVSVSLGRINGYRFVGGVIGVNMPIDSFELQGLAVTTSRVGSIYADAAVGGVIGYNQLLATAPGRDEDETLEDYYAKQLPTFKNSVLTEALTSSGNAITLENIVNDTPIYANAYAGGIIGYNAETTRLTLTATNNGAISRADNAYLGENPTLRGVSVNAFLAAKGYATAQQLPTDTTASLLGGIVSVNTQSMTLTGCANTGNISGSANVLGGLAGLNEGVITNCTNKTNLGSSQQNYVGGITGINAAKAAGLGSITACTVNGTINGNNEVGGMAGANLAGAALDATGLAGNVSGRNDVGGAVGLNLGTLAANKTSGTVRGVNNVGGIVGSNAGTVSSATVAAAVSVNGTNYIGGVAGYNTSTGTVGSDTQASITSKVSSLIASTDYAGGVVGYNAGTIKNVLFENDAATLRATRRFAGGLAGYNAANASIENSSFAAGTVKSDTGVAGGITSVNAGTVQGCTVLGGQVTSDGAYESNGVTTMAVGAAVAVNEGTLTGTTVSGGTLAGNSTVAGGLAGYNAGTVTGCTVSAMPAVSELTAGSINIGGAVGVNAKQIETTNVTADIAASDKFTNLGGVVGSNNGTLEGCTYAGALGGSMTTGATHAGDTIGGIAGSNNGVLSGCTVESITLQVLGSSNANSAMDAETKLASASHVGGIAGRNNANATISGCALKGDSSNTSQIIAKRGFVGGIAGSNSGSITTSGGADTQELVTKVNEWLNGGNDGLNAMVRVLTGKANASDADETTMQTNFSNVKGIDTVSEKGYTNVYEPTQNGNNVLVALKGGSTSTDMANGYLGGLVGFNSVSGSVSNSATGKWFVYSDNASMTTPAGGAIGQNESNAENAGLLNCAAVRRFSRCSAKDDEDTNINNEKKTGNSNGNVANVAHIGGVIGYQQNRTSGDWALSRLVNCGTVFNSRSNNVGGVVAYWINNGGTVQQSFNFGLLTTNMNDGNSSGGVGGIIGYYDRPTNGISTTIRSCQNYGSVYYENQGANDVAGIVGRVSIASTNDTMTINVIDCVNAAASMKAQSMVCGIFGFMGSWYTKIDGVSVNIDRCRNFCTGLYASKKVGICGNRSGNGGTDGTKAGTSVTNCFSLVDGFTARIYYKALSNETVSGSNNYYMDADSFSDTYISGLKTLGRSYTPSIVQNVTTSQPIDSDTLAQWFNGSKTVKPAVIGANKELTISFDLTKQTTIKEMKLFENGNTNDADAVRYKVTAHRTNGKSYTLSSSYKIDESVSLSSQGTLKGITLTISMNSTANLNIAEIEFQNSGGTWINYPNGGNPTGSNTVGEMRLYAGIDNDAGESDGTNNYSYFAALPANNVKAQNLFSASTKIQSTDFASQSAQRTLEVNGTVSSGTPSPAATLNLLYNEADDLSGVTLHDVTDEAIQNYYTYVLDANVPFMGGTPTVALSGAGASDSVYGRYEVKWDKPTSGSAQHYNVQLYLVKQGDETQDTPLWESPVTVYDTNYTFEVPAVWQQYVTDGRQLYAVVTAVNSKGESNPVQSAAVQFAKPLPTPELRVELVKSGSAYARQLRLVNAEAYSEVDGWSVTASFLDSNGNVAESYTLTADTPTQKNTSLNIKASINGTGTLRAEANYTKVLSAGESAKWLRSEQLSEPIYIPNPYPTTTLTMVAPTVTGTTLADLSITAKLSFTTDKSISPLYHVALFGTRTAELTADGINLKGQTITLASQDLAIPASGATVTFSGSSLPADLLDSYNNFIVAAVPYQSGLGSYYTYYDCTAADAGLGAAEVAAVRDRGYEILAGADGSYTYRAVYPFISYASSNTACLQKFSLGITALDAPTLMEDFAADQPVIENNKMSYTFTWLAPADTDKLAAAYVPTLVGITYKAGTMDEVESETSIDISTAYTDAAATTLTVNADNWTYDAVRLTVARKGDSTGTTKYIGKSATQTYAVKQRLPQISAPAVDFTDSDHRNLLYTVNWVGVSEEYKEALDHYTVFVTDADGNVLAQQDTVTPEGGAVPETLDIDLDKCQGATVQIYVVAIPEAGSEYKQSPNGITTPLTVETRYATPIITGAGITPPTNLIEMSKFKTNLITTVNLDESTPADQNRNYYFSAYFFDAPEDAAAAKETIAEGNAPAKSTTEGDGGYQDAFGVDETKPLAGGIVMTFGNATTLSAKLVLSAENAQRYMVVRVSAAPSNGIASQWAGYFDEAKTQLPKVRLDTPAGALNSLDVTRTGTIYLEETLESKLKDTEFDFGAFAAQWAPVELATSYALSAVPLMDAEGKPLYPQADVTIEVAQTGDVDADNQPLVPGSIKRVTKEVALQEVTGKDADGNEITLQKEETVTIEIPQVDGSYDLSTTIATEENGVAQRAGDAYRLVSQPAKLVGRIIYNEMSVYYCIEMAPTLTALTDESGAVTGYQVVLPDTSTTIGSDTESKSFTQKVTVQAKSSNDKIVESFEGEIPVNDTTEGQMLMMLEEPAETELQTEQPTPETAATTLAALAAQLMQSQTAQPATPETAAPAA